VESSLIWYIDAGADLSTESEALSFTLKLQGRYPLSSLFVPVGQMRIVNGDGDNITPSTTGLPQDDRTYLVTINFAPNSPCGTAPFCYYSTVEGLPMAGNADDAVKKDWNMPFANTPGGADFNALDAILNQYIDNASQSSVGGYGESPENYAKLVDFSQYQESPEPSPLPFPDSQPAERVFQQTRPLPIDIPESPENYYDPLNAATRYTCPQFWWTWEPMCYNIAYGCPQCWSSASSVNPSGTSLTVARTYDATSMTTTFVFSVKWGSTGCGMMLGSDQPMDRFCQMEKFVVPLVHGIKPDQVGYVNPQAGVPANEVVTHSEGCDEGTMTGMKNVVTWNLNKVDDAEWGAIVQNGGEFASLSFVGMMMYEDVFPSVFDGIFHTSDTGLPPKDLVAIPPGAVAMYAETANGACANGYYQYNPAAVYPTYTHIGGKYLIGSGEEVIASSTTIITAGGMGTESITNGGVSAIMNVPGVGEVAFVVEDGGRTVYVLGYGKLDVKGEAGQAGFVTIPGIGNVFVPGVTAPIASTAVSEVPEDLVSIASAAVNGSVPVSAVLEGSVPVVGTASVAVSNAGINCPTTVSPTKWGDLDPTLKISPESLTLSPGQTGVFTVTMEGSIDPGSYTGGVNLTFTPGGDGTCVETVAPEVMMTMVYPTTAFVLGNNNYNKEESSSGVVTSLSKAAGGNLGVMTVKIAVDVSEPIVAEAINSLAVVKALAKFRQSVDPSEKSLSAWTPSTSTTSTTTPMTVCRYVGVVCDGNGAVIAIQLRGFMLDGSLPSDPSVWSALPSLSVLDLADNALTGSIPASMSALSSAATIDLSNNRLTGTIAPSFSSFSPAATMKLDGNAALCGGLPRIVSQAVSISTAGTSIDAPCFSTSNVIIAPSPTDAAFAVAGPTRKMTFTSQPSPILSGNGGKGFIDFDSLMFKVETAPSSGSLILTGEGGVGEESAEGKDLSWNGDLLSGRLHYRPSSLTKPDKFVLTISTPTSSPTLMEFHIQPSTVKSAGFSRDSRVLVQDASGASVVKPLSEVVVGDRVQSLCTSMVCYEEIITLALAQEGMPAPMMQIVTKDGSVITIGGNHYLMQASSSSTTDTSEVSLSPVAAHTITPGMFISTVDPSSTFSSLVSSEVATVQWVTVPTGRFLPITNNGNIIVDGAAASTYTDVKGSLQAMHDALFPVREAYVKVKSGAYDWATYHSVAGELGPALLLNP